MVQQSSSPNTIRVKKGRAKEMVGKISVLKVKGVGMRRRVPLQRYSSRFGRAPAGSRKKRAKLPTISLPEQHVSAFVDGDVHKQIHAPMQNEEE